MCEFWGSHFRAGHVISNAVAPDTGQLCGDIVEDTQETIEEEIVNPPTGLVTSSMMGGGAFAKLRASGLL